MKFWKNNLLNLFVISLLIICHSCGTLLKAPKKEVLDAKVCKHRWGMQASFTQTTDLYLTSQLAYAAEFYGLKYNIPLTVFDFQNRGQDQIDSYKMGRIDYGVYTNSCNSRVEKSPRSFIIEYINIITKIREGKRPSTLSYGCGIDTYKNEVRDLFLMGRNSLSSNHDNSFSNYDSNFDNLQDTSCSILSQISRPSTTRYFHLVKEKNNSGLEIVKEHIEKTYKTGGFYTDFCHWQAFKHYKIPVGELAIHFKNMGEAFDSLNVFRGSYNDIAEYYFAKQAVDKTSVIRKKKKIIISVSASKKGNYDYSLISTPVSIRIEFTNNRLSNYNFKSVKGGNIRKMEDGDLIIELKTNFIADKIIISDTLIIVKDPNYLNFSVPQLIIENNIVQSDQKVKITVFKKKINSDDRTISICERSLVSMKEHILMTIKEDEFDYFIGYINNTGNSGLIIWK